MRKACAVKGRRLAVLAVPVMLMAVRATAAFEPPAPVEPAETPGPRLVIKGFTDVNYGVNEERLPNTFSLGQIDLFVTSALSETLSVLGEFGFEFEPDGETAIDVERIQVRYAPSDEFTLTAGRMHTPLGFWNQTYHHGRWFQTTADRPQMYLFEDDGGILPIHEIGVQAAGTIHGRAVDLKYSASVANGRAAVPSEVTNAQDPDSSKALNFLVGLAPSSPRGLEFGVNAYLDRIPARSDVPGAEPLRETILGAYGVYVQAHFELLAEASRIHHRGRVTGRTFESWGLYGQGAVRVGSWKPYYRFDRVTVAEGDPFLPDRRLSLHTAGLRWDASAWLAIKGEYHFTREGGEDFHSARGQVAFAF